jgi:hypothetical protein
MNFLNDKVGTDMAEKEPKSTSKHSCLKPHERLNVIGSLPALPSKVALKVAEPICERISICGQWRFVGGDR